MSKKRGIVLNRMYTGSYLSTNLGHEIINMFQADNGKHYLYLNSKGNFSPRGKDMRTMLLVRGIGNKQVEVVGMAKNLVPIESACCTLPRDLGRINVSAQKAQQDLMRDIEYGGVPINKIFEGMGQQSVFVSYVTNDKSFYLPLRRIILNFGSSTEWDGALKVDLSISFSSTSLHQFIEQDTASKDWKMLQAICENDGLWKLDNTKVFVPNDFCEREDSIFDVCGIQDDENKFSNALCYYMKKYPSLWRNFFQSRLNDINLAEIDSVSREENAKVSDAKCKLPTGGRIDLLIRTNNCDIIIENKIDSRIIVEGGVSQIQRYYNYLICQKKEDTTRLVNMVDNLTKDKQRIESKYNRLTKKRKGKLGQIWLKEIEVLSERICHVEQELANVESKELRGFLLSPNYNKPLSQDYQVKYYTYGKLLYSDIYNWLEENAHAELEQDYNFKAFHDAMRKHTFETLSEALYEEMKNMFFSRINKLHPYVQA